MRNHGFEYKDPDHVALGDRIVTKFRPLGESEHVRTVADSHLVVSMVCVHVDEGYLYQYTLNGKFQPYQVSDTAQVPVTNGPC